MAGRLRDWLNGWKASRAVWKAHRREHREFKRLARRTGIDQQKANALVRFYREDH
jgi:hypothetical protein